MNRVHIGLHVDIDDTIRLRLLNPIPDDKYIRDNLNTALLTLRSYGIDYEIECCPTLAKSMVDIFLITSDEGIVAFKLAGGKIFLDNQNAIERIFGIDKNDG